MESNDQAAAQGEMGPMHIADQLAAGLWAITAAWNDFAKTTIGVPLIRAVDELCLQLHLTVVRAPVKQHLQHIANARRALVPLDYYLHQARRRGLVEAASAEQLRGRLTELAQRLDQHTQSVIKTTNQKMAERKKDSKSAPQAETDRATDSQAKLAH